MVREVREASTSLGEDVGADGEEGLIYGAPTTLKLAQ
jgi:hypothetical protein